MCDGFTVEGSTQGSWSDTNAGDTVTVTCQEDHVLEGNSDIEDVMDHLSKLLRCTSNGEWSSEAPKCTKVGKLILVRFGSCVELEIRKGFRLSEPGGTKTVKPAVDETFKLFQIV